MYQRCLDIPPNHTASDWWSKQSPELLFPLLSILFLGFYLWEKIPKSGYLLIVIDTTSSNPSYPVCPAINNSEEGRALPRAFWPSATCFMERHSRTLSLLGTSQLGLPPLNPALPPLRLSFCFPSRQTGVPLLPLTSHVLWLYLSQNAWSVSCHCDCGALWSVTLSPWTSPRAGAVLTTSEHSEIRTEPGTQ